MTVRVACFARIREIVGGPEIERELAEGGTAGDVFDGLARQFPALRELAGTTRFVRGARLIEPGTALRDGDELGLLPPYGGG